MGKLVRDKIPEIIKQDGKEPIVRLLNNEEYLLELKRKLLEESAEFVKATDLTSMKEELADVLEVIQATIVAIGFDLQEIQRIQLSKQKDRGGFKEQIYWEGNK